MFTALFVPASIILGMLLASALNRPIRFIGFYRTAIFVPFVASAAATGILANYVFSPQFGIANAALRALGLPEQQFLESDSQALLTLCIIALWGEIGFCVVIYLAALQDIPENLVEAAMIDGASTARVFWHIKVPHLAPVTVFAAVWQTITALTAVRHGVHDDQGRTAGFDPDGRLLRLLPGVPAHPLRLRVGDRLHLVRLHADHHCRGHLVLATRSDGGLLMATGTIHDDTAYDMPPDEARRSATSPVRRSRLPFSPWHLLLMPTALLFLLPLVQMILASFMTNADLNRFPPRFIPTALTTNGYEELFEQSSMVRWLVNSTIVSVVAVVSHLFLCSLAGYGFARLKFRGRQIGFFLMVSTIMIPIQLLMIPTFVMFSKIGLIDTSVRPSCRGSRRRSGSS